ncbi:MAG: hypothetical protein M0R03_18675 [Novosphingobium sp.]|jgi:nitrate reductase gamma subunit|nr:hypothetical protein [Novosphingobium sp.]
MKMNDRTRAGILFAVVGIVCAAIGTEALTHDLQPWERPIALVSVVAGGVMFAISAIGLALRRDDRDDD